MKTYISTLTCIITTDNETRTIEAIKAALATVPSVEILDFGGIEITDPYAKAKEHLAEDIELGKE